MADTDPIATLDRLLVDDPYGPGFDEARAVAGDLLQAKGHIRGELIALEQLVERAPTREAERDALATLESWVADHEAQLFRGLAVMRHKLGAMRYWFRGGRVERLFIDTRRVIMPEAKAELYKLTIPELMAVVLDSPAVKHVRNLEVRVRRPQEAPDVVTAVRKLGSKLAVEQLMVSMTTRPTGHYPPSHRHDVVALRKDLGQLWLATEYGEIVPLYERDLSDEATAAELDELEVGPMTRALRVRLGRGLTSNRPETTKVACEKIAQLGESGRVFLPALIMMLRPQVSAAAQWILPVLPHFPAWKQELLPAIRSATGGTKHDVKVIRAAQKALPAMSL